MSRRRELRMEGCFPQKDSVAKTAKPQYSFPIACDDRERYPKRSSPILSRHELQCVHPELGKFVKNTNVTTKSVSPKSKDKNIRSKDVAQSDDRERYPKCSAPILSRHDLRCVHPELGKFLKDTNVTTKSVSAKPKDKHNISLPEEKNIACNDRERYPKRSTPILYDSRQDPSCGRPELAKFVKDTNETMKSVSPKPRDKYQRSKDVVQGDERERYPKRSAPILSRHDLQCVRPELAKCVKDTKVTTKSVSPKPKDKKNTSLPEKEKISKVNSTHKDTPKFEDIRYPQNKYLWTRLVCSKDGYRKYEVYKESSAENVPISEQTPVIVLLLLPNAFLMPFTTMLDVKKKKLQ
ncbi:uncharacterized protein [Drosophila bipectinata]|uniref:uncharacterized protein n=1 Tax=Drosophila bipectinata TaxID=42026 RepID=UPI001C89481D|nr:uncharacterized protein LOC122322221 [Drosophila bipectinata]